MREPIYGKPKITKNLTDKSCHAPNAKKLRLEDDICSIIQKGGRSEALKMLDSFFSQRGRSYTKEMSSPVTAYHSCSRLSPHLAFGTISIREVFQKTEAARARINIDTLTKYNNLWRRSLRSFSSRLRWHCHFIQKLEDEPQIEYENMHSAYNTLRQDPINWGHFEAWKKGQTGFPMIDACMRSLISTGWLNFRMRAMLVSFASYHLWLHWRKPAIYLARLFTDYEPGIHYSQAQMQSGTTGINSIRIYNPIKQGLDHDPEGTFIRKWVPELAALDIKYIHKPWESKMPLDNYPSPIVDEKSARQAAAKNIYTLRYSSMHKEISRDILKKHGSRKKNHRVVKMNKQKEASLNEQNIQQEMLF
jgi:deoxyribodipyrimidine photo-lyase